MNTATGNGIEMPENLFKAIDRVHKEATEIYGKIDNDALELISPNRKIQKESVNSTVNKARTGIKPK